MKYRFIFILVLLAGCATRSPLVPPAHKGMLVGTWVSKSQDQSWIISRDSSGEFVEKRNIHFSNTNTTDTLVGRGLWSVDNEKYSLHYQSISGSFGQNLVGKTIDADIISQSKNRFVFRFEDSMSVTEKRTSYISLKNIPAYKLKGKN
jgi:hypothetical protein